MKPTPLISRLTRLRRTVRRRLLAYGVFSVAAGGAAAFLTIITLDYFLWMPAVLRLIVGGLFFAGFVAASLHWIVRPVLAKFGVSEVAARIETHFPSLDDRLLSAVHFQTRGPTGSLHMAQQVVADAEQVLADLQPERALSIKPVVLRGALMVCSFAFLVGVLGVAPEWARTGLYRYVHPWGEIEWPRTVAIAPLTGNRVVAVGDSATVRMAVRRGLRDGLRALVRLREPDGRITTLAMKRDADGVFYATIDALTTDLQYWFEAGDDSTYRNASTLRAVRRPELVSALATVEPPPYATDHQSRLFDLSDGPVAAPVSGSVRLELRANKPIPSEPDRTQSGLRTNSEEWIPLDVDTADATSLSVRLDVVADVQFRVELRDRFGLENRGGGWFTIRALPDRPPEVFVLEPSGVTELTPHGAVPLRVRVEDDFGITRVELHAALNEDHVITTLPADRPDPVPQADHVETVIEDVWSAAPLSLNPGDVVTLTVAALDTRPLPDALGQEGRSAPVRIRIISEAEFDVRVRTELAQLESRIREAALAQAELLDHTTSLKRFRSMSEGSAVQQRDDSDVASTRQVLLAQRVRELSDRFRDLADRVERGRPGEPDVARQIHSLADSVAAVASGPMTAAGQRLADAARSDETSRRLGHFDQAIENQQAALDRLQNMLRKITEWGGFHEMVTKTRDLFDRQQSLRIETADLGKELLGRAVETLSADERDGLNRTARSQEQLASGIRRLLDRMRSLSSDSASSDPLTAEALDAALRAASAFDLNTRLDNAVESIRTNRTASAGLDQKVVADVLRTMLEAFAERQQRQLEELRKQLADATQQIAELIEQQQAVRNATREVSLFDAPMEPENLATWLTLHETQLRLSRNTSLLGDELAAGERTAAGAAAPIAGRHLREAGTAMNDASEYLHQQSAPPALTAQDTALGLLKEALSALEEEARRVEDEWLRRSLAQIRDGLAEILEGQTAANDGIIRLAHTISVRGDIGRVEARTAARLARQQDEVLSLAAERMQDFQRVVVYRWSMQRIMGWMTDSRTRLASRRIDDELVDLTGRIVREIQKLIDAIDATQALPFDSQFVETDGGGDGVPSSAKPVPTVAELLLLKSMQDDLNDRTARLHESLDPILATESQLRQLRVLAEDQAELSRLAEKVTRQAREP